MVRFRLSAFLCFSYFSFQLGRFSRMGWLRGLTVNEIVRCATRPDVGLWWGVSGFSDGLLPCDGVRRPFFRGCDTPMNVLCRKGFDRVSGKPICVDWRCAVGLSLAARHGGLASGDWGGLLVWWWFENSRAYLYYFFIVNDCQSVLRPARFSRVGAGRPVKRDGVFADSPFS